MEDTKPRLFNDGMLNAFGAGWKCHFDRWNVEEGVEKTKTKLAEVVRNPKETAKKVGTGILSAVKHPQQTVRKARQKAGEASEKAENVLESGIVAKDMSDYQSFTPWRDLVVTAKIPTGIENTDESNTYYSQKNVLAYHAGRATKDTVNYIKHHKEVCFGWALLAMVSLSRPVTFGASTIITAAAVQFVVHRPARLNENDDMLEIGSPKHVVI
jgi:hypothetical protein